MECLTSRDTCKEMSEWLERDTRAYAERMETRMLLLLGQEVPEDSPDTVTIAPVPEPIEQKVILPRVTIACQ